MATAARAIQSNKKVKLKELAEKRVPAAIEKIRLIGNLAGYKPSSQQVDKIMSALCDACKKIEGRLRGNVEEEEAPFEL